MMAEKKIFQYFAHTRGTRNKMIDIAASMDKRIPGFPYAFSCEKKPLNVMPRSG